MRKAPQNPENVSQFLLRVEEISKRFDLTGKYTPWFRGQQRTFWGLCPKVYRDYGGFRRVKRERLEDEIREEFIIRAPIFSESRPAEGNEWEWYFLMQHFGSPTRLLDWTEGALLGLYFAVRDNPGFYDAAVWVLDPYELNRVAIHKEEVIPPSVVSAAQRRLVDRWLPARFKSMAKVPRRPVAVLPSHVARRISTQRSCFTVHGKDTDGLDRLLDKKRGCLEKIVIPSYNAVSIRRELVACGIDEATIFPDLEGFGRSLATKWRSDGPIIPHVDVYTRLRPSKIAKGGVGVFAIQKILKGTPLFVGENEEMVWVEPTSFSGASTGIRKMYEDFAVFRNGRRGCPQNFNRLTTAWYLNEPTKGEKPNVRVSKDTFDFEALDDIEEGEELTVDYSTYNDELPPGGVASTNRRNRR